MNNWKNAAQRKLRINTGSRSLSPEQLYDLPRESKSGLSLNGLYAEIQGRVQSTQGLGLVQKSTNTDDELRLALIKEVFEDKLAEAAAKAESAQKATRRRQLMEALAQKKEQAILGMTEEEIKKELEGL